MSCHSPFYLLAVAWSLVELFNHITHQNFTKIFDNVIQNKLSSSLTEPKSLNTWCNVTYSDGVEIDSAQLPETNDPVIPYGTAVLGTPSLINGFM